MVTCQKRLSTAIKTYRRRKKKHAYVLDEERFRLPDDQTAHLVDDCLDRIHNRECVDRILAVLNERERKIAELHFNQDMSFEEIAEQEHSTIGAVKAVLARLISKARKEVEKNPHHFFIFFVSILLLVRYIG